MSPRAFVSSTFADLRDHRAHVIRALQDAGFDVVAMEHWTASPGEPKEFSQKRIEGCDLCVLLLAFRRGFVPDDESLSITQMEYEYALEHGIEVLPFVLKDEADWEPRFNELAGDEQLREWRARVVKRHGVGFFERDAASVPVAPALTRWLAERHERERLGDYLAAVRAAHGELKFYGLPQLRDNRDVRIDRLFVNPFFCPRYLSPDSDPREWRDTVPMLDSVVRDSRVVALGDPGCGKSTLVNWIAWQLAQEHPSAWADALGKRIPVPLILRDLRIGPGVTWDALLAAFLRQPVGKNLGGEPLEHLLQLGRAFLLLDGLDEIGNVAIRRDLRDAVQEAMQRYHKCRWLLTSRIVGYDDVPFHVTAHSSLPEPVARRLTRAGIGVSLAEVRYVAPFNDAQIEQFARHWYAERESVSHRAEEGTNNLIEAIHADKATTRLARIPNLLTIMALIHRVRARLPHGKALLYNEIAQAYLETIDDYRKIRETNDTLADKKQWLARAGFEMQRQRSAAAEKAGKAFGRQEREILATAADVRRWIMEGMRTSGKGGDEDDASRFVEYVKHRSGLMIERADEQFAFTHLSFQEYFAACYMAEQVTSPDWLAEGQAGGLSRDEFRRFANSSLWREPLVFLAELIAAERPRWHRSLINSLFGGDWRNLLSADGDQEPTLCLLARLAVDPYALPDGDQREQSARLCCRWEVARHARLWSVDRLDHNSDVLGILLGTAHEERGRHLAFLVDVARAEGVRDLSFAGTSIRDLTPLAGLTQLQTLHLNSTRVTNLTPLAGLTQLETLDLHSTGVADLSPLAGLPRLEMLILSFTNVTDLSPLAGLKQLRWVMLPWNLRQTDDQVKRLQEALPKLQIV